MIDEKYVESLLSDPNNIDNFVEAYKILNEILNNCENDEFLISLSEKQANKIFDEKDYVNSVLARHFVKNHVQNWFKNTKRPPKPVK